MARKQALLQLGVWISCYQCAVVALKNRNGALPGIRFAGWHAAVERWLESRYHQVP
jgi:hypothetical protein